MDASALSWSDDMPWMLHRRIGAVASIRLHPLAGSRQAAIGMVTFVEPASVRSSLWEVMANDQQRAMSRAA